MTTYLDCNATTPLDPSVIDLVRHYLEIEFGNSGSRTHELGAAAKSAVEKARGQIAAVVNAQSDEVLFTSGATESNNLAIIGLSNYLKAQGKNHIVTTAIEHKAVLEPCAALEEQGMRITYLLPNSDGIISVDQIKDSICPDTGLISVMQVNNETGAIQPVEVIADYLSGTDIYFHVDAAQGFGKLLEPLTSQRIDLISVSGHKIYGPKGIGALIARRRNYKRPPLTPLMYGGGQEKGLRPGTLPVPLIAGFGLAAANLSVSNKIWWEICTQKKLGGIEALEGIGARIHGKNTMPNVINASIPGINSEAAIVSLKGIAAISNGSACTSNSYTASHVLEAMGLDEVDIQGALRFSWCHMTPDIPWLRIIDALKALR